MPISVATTRVALRTTVGTQDITIPGVGVPKAALLLLNQASSDGVATDHDIVSMGLTDGGRQFAMTARAAHGVTGGSVSSVQVTTACVYKITVTGTPEVVGVWNAWITDGVRLQLTTAPTTAYLLTVVLFGGSELTAYVGSLASSTALNDTVVTTAPGFAFDDLLGMSAYIATTGSATVYRQALGVCHFASPLFQQQSLFWARSGVSPSNIYAALNTTHFVYLDIGGEGKGLEITARSATGFSVTSRLPGYYNAATFGYLALHYGGAAQSWIGTVTTPTGTGAQSYTGPGFPPQTVLLAQSLLPTVNAYTTDATAGSTAISLLTSTRQYCLAQSAADNVTTTNTQSLQDDVALIVPQDTGITGVAATLTSLDATGWTLDYSAVLGSARQGWAWAIESEVPTGPVTRSLTATLLSATTTPAAVGEFLVPLAHDAVSESAQSASVASFTWNHVPGGIPTGVLVFTFTNANADDATGVTYAGVPVTAVSGGRAIDTAGEAGDCKAWFLGSGIPTTTPAPVIVTRNNNANVMYAVCITLTAPGNTELKGTPVIVQGDGQHVEQNVDAGSGVLAVRYAGTQSGLGAIIDNPGTPGTSLSRGANSTWLADIDFGQRVIGVVRETTSGVGSRPVGFVTAVGTNDDRAAVHVAIGNVVVGTLRELTASLSSATTTPGSPIDLAIALQLVHPWFLTFFMRAAPAAFVVRQLTAQVSLATETLLSTPTVAHALTATLTSSITTPTSVAAQARALTADLPSDTSTPVTPVSQIRALIGTLASDTSTPPASATMTQLRELTAGLFGTTSTPPIPVTQACSLRAVLSSATATPDSPSLQTRALTATLESPTTTPPITSLMGGQISLTASLTSATTTPTSPSTQTRALVATVPLPTLTPDLPSPMAEAPQGVVHHPWTLFFTTSRRGEAVAVPGIAVVHPGSMAVFFVSRRVAAAAVVRSFAAAASLVTTTPLVAATVQRSLRATLASSTTTPDSPSTQPRTLTAVLPSASTTPASPVTQARALTATLLGTTTTPGNEVTTSRRLTATLLGATMTPPAVEQSHPLTTTYIVQDRTLATTWALSMTAGVLGWAETGAAAQPDPVVLDIGDETTHWMLSIDDGILGQTQTTNPLVRLTLADSSIAGTSWEVFVQEGVVVWRQLMAGTIYVVQDRTVTTTWALSIAAGVLSWTETAAAAQPDPVVLDIGDETTHWTLSIDAGVLGYAETTDPLVSLFLADSLQANTYWWAVGVQEGVLLWRQALPLLAGVVCTTSTEPITVTLATLRALSATLSAATTTPASPATQALTLTATLPLGTSTPNSAMTQARALTASLSPSTSTPPIAISMAGILQLTAALSGTTTTPTSAVTQAHGLTAAVLSSTVTPPIAVMMAGQRALTAVLSPVTTTLDSPVTQTRAFTATLSPATSTPSSPVTMATLRQLSAVLTGTTTTPTSGLTQARALTATLPVGTTTPSSALAQIRALTGILAGVTATPPIAVQMAGIIQLLASVLSTTTTPGAPATQARALTGTLTSVTTTPTSAVTMAGIRPLLATLLAQSSTPTSAATQTRGLTSALGAATSTPPVTIALAGVRQLGATLLASTTTPLSTPTSQRALTSTLLSTTLTPGTSASVTRPLLATLPSATTTPTSPTLLARGVTAQPLGSTSTPSAPVPTFQRRLVAGLSSLTTTPGVTIFVTGQVAFLTDVLVQTVTSAPTIHLVHALTSSLSTTSVTPDSAQVLRRNVLAHPSTSTTTPGVLPTVARALLAAPANTSTTPGAAVILQRTLTAVLATDSTTPPVTGEMAGIRALTAVLVSSSSTPSAAAVVLRPLLAAVSASPSTPSVPHVQQRTLTGLLVASTTTPVALTATTVRTLLTTVPAVTTTPLAVAGLLRDLTATLFGATSTTDGVVFLSRALTATPLLSTLTLPVLTIETLRDLVAAVLSVTSSPEAPILVQGQVLLFASPDIDTSTPHAAALQFRALLAALDVVSSTLLAALDPGSWSEVLRQVAPTAGATVTLAMRTPVATISRAPPAEGAATLTPIIRPAKAA